MAFERLFGFCNSQDATSPHLKRWGIGNLPHFVWKDSWLSRICWITHRQNRQDKTCSATEIIGRIACRFDLADSSLHFQRRTWILQSVIIVIQKRNINISPNQLQTRNERTSPLSWLVLWPSLKLKDSKWNLCMFLETDGIKKMRGHLREIF